MSGPPPAAVSPVLGCWYQNPTGKFVDPTWTSDGVRLAWQENDGVWLGALGGLSCPLPDPVLILPGASEPDFGPAPVNPGPRPPCGNPGNPSCTPLCTVNCIPCPTCVPQVTLSERLAGLLGAASKKLRSLRIRGLLRKGRFTIEFTAPGPGTLTASLTAAGASARRATLLATGRRVYKAAGKAKLTIKLTGRGRQRLRRARRLTATLKVSFAPIGAKAISTKGRVRLKR
jgi:hypothetical protein